MLLVRLVWISVDMQLELCVFGVLYTSTVHSWLTSGGTLGAGATICQSELVPPPTRC